MQNKVEHVEDNGESQGLIKTPRQLIITIFLAFLIPVIGIILLVKLVTVTSPMGAGSEAQSSESIAQRVQPVAQFRLVDAAADASDESRTGEQVYDLTCATCHAAGVAGAPTLGDNAAWAPLIETGFDEMVKIAIEGVGAMPPRGGNPSLSDLEVARAVAHMANNSGGSFEEPADDAADAAADQAAAPSADAAADTEAATDTDAAAGTQQAATSPDPAEVQQILTKNACLACHAVDSKLVGPSYRDVAGKYADEAGAAETLAQHVKQGSSGIWGPIPMPPNPGISDDDLTKVVNWVLAGAPDVTSSAGGDTDASADAKQSDDAAAPEADATQKTEATAEDATKAAEPEAAADTDAAAETQQAAAPDPAEVQQILTKNACLACHAVDSKLVGPSYRDVAGKYADEAGAAETLAQHVKQGSSGIWGPIPMPPNPGISDDDLTKVVNWVLAGAPDVTSSAGGDTDASADAKQSDDAAAPEADATQKTEATAEDATKAAEPEAAADTDAAAETQQAAAPDPAEVQQILTKNACLACHAVENKLIGPSYRDVAGKYADEAGAAETLAQHVKQGSSGIWGPIPMPPNPGISDDDLAKVVDWVLAGAPE